MGNSLKLKFTNSKEYWINRYKSGESSGAGSYNELAKFKAAVINEFLVKNNIKTVIDLGCGDGNQLNYLKPVSYIGFDISPFILEKCKTIFHHDKSKTFLHINMLAAQSAELVLSLDVIYHLVENDVYENYLNQLFDHASLFVIIYSHDSDITLHEDSVHIKSRKFTDWIRVNKPNFTLIKYIPNKYPFKKEKSSTTSISDFYIYKRISE